MIRKQGSPQQQVSDGRADAIASFERFMNWLGPDPDTAGQRYESIRNRLITMFRSRQCVVAEDLADATIERVIKRLPQLSTEFTGDPTLYFYGVAKKIYLEYRRTVINDISRIRCWQPSVDDDDLQPLYEQLDEALSRLSISDRQLILEYYSGVGHEKIVQRRQLAKQLRIGLGALRLRVFRLRKEIKQYMLRSNNLIRENIFWPVNNQSTSPSLTGTTWPIQGKELL